MSSITDRRQRFRAVLAGPACIHPGSVFDPMSVAVLTTWSGARGAKIWNPKGAKPRSPPQARSSAADGTASISA